MMRKYLFFSLVLLAVIRASSLEGAGTTGAEFLRIDAPASTAAVGAGAAVSAGSETLVWNPAGIIGQHIPSLSFTHVVSFVDTAYEQLEGVYPGWLGGSWSGRLFYASTYNFIEVNEYGEEVGELENYDLLIHLAHARVLGPGLQVGLAVKVFESVLAGYSSQGFAMDMGVQYLLPGIPLCFGIAIQNLGTMSAFEAEADPLPVLLVAGTALTFSPLAGHKLNFRLDVQQLFVGDEEASVLAGLEYCLNQLVILRGGYRIPDELGTISLGIGIQYDGFGLDYAYHPFNGLGDNHRFTFTYYFQPKVVVEPTPRELKTQEVAVMHNIPPVELKVASEARPKIKTLTVMPRKFEGKLLFKTPRLDPAVKEWNFEIRDYEGKIIKRFSGVAPLPEILSWDGRDQTGQLVPQQGKYQFVFQVEGKDVLAQRIPQVQPALKLLFADGSTIEPGVRFVLTRRPTVERWRLTIRQRQEQKVVRVLAGEGELPQEIMWDGKNESGEIADTRLKYEYDLALVFPDHSEILVSEVIQAIPARRVPAPKGKVGLLIYGILFDFNSAVLDPDMTDKCLAAAEIVRRYPGQTQVICEGHADEIGSVAVNLRISRDRAHMVANFLAARPYVTSKLISLIGYGKSRPENTLKSEAGRARNRRVEIRLYIPAQ